ncbi:MAG: alpha/beta hydrolase [Spirochaetes bacterium]|nr:alpha/beta hydrolase [Spirochaetota bacterium]
MFFVAAGSGVPVLFVHGNIGSSRWWAGSMDLPGYRTVAVDMPNFGRSDPLPGWSAESADLAAYAEYLALFIEASGLERPIVVAHSLGGAVAQALVAARPDLVRALVLVDSGPPSGLVTPKERHPAIEAMRTNPAILSMALKAVVPTMKDDAWFAGLAADARLMAEPAWIGNAEALSRFDCRGRLDSFAKAVLVVWGRKDVIVTEAMARETAAAFPNARLEVVETVGHSIMVEDPGLWKNILERFLDAAAR